MTGWLVYEAAGAERNRRFIEMITEYAERAGVSLPLVLCDEGLPEGKPDFAVVRAMRPDISRKLSSRGVRVFNNARVSEVCNNKARTYEFLSERGIPTLPWKSAKSGEVPPEISEYPAVVKPCCGHGGMNVTLVKNDAEYMSARRKIAPDEYIVQPVATGAGRDLRVYILGGEPVAAVQRIADGDFRSNFSLGGSIEAHMLTAEERELVGRVCDSIYFDYCGIDIMYHEGKAVINEIEDVVGARMLYETHDIDIAKMYVEYIIDKMA